MNEVLKAVTRKVVERSRKTRSAYLARMERQGRNGPNRTALACSNLAHGMAACGAQGKERLTDEVTPNIAIVTAYNDMLSAHQPYERYPELIRQEAGRLGAVAQVAGGVPAMCDGITQGERGMELSLFSRDVIAMATAIALSHNMYDGVLCLGICDKIVPGLLMGALTFGHLPVLFVPAGPMPSGLSNREKAAVREAYASGDAGRPELLAAESAAYHSPGTCTFYGTANSNQMLMEFMGLQLPGGSFVNPNDPLRDSLTRAAVARILMNAVPGEGHVPLYKTVDEKAIVNGIVGLLATGGSTNHTIHLVAVAAAAGIRIDWDDFADLSEVIPLLCQVYPNGSADVNHFHAAGGLGFVIRELLDAELLHDDVMTIAGPGLRNFTQAPTAAAEGLEWRPVPQKSGDHSVLRRSSEPFSTEGGLRVCRGNIGRAVVKTSAVAAQHQSIEAPARVFDSQEAVIAAFERHELDSDVVIVLIGQGPRANGMPELHKLTPFLGVLQNRGLRVALVTDGRMSGASGKVLAAIQVTPEASCGGPVGRIRDGDLVAIDAGSGLLEVRADLDERDPRAVSADTDGCGTELFGLFRGQVGDADRGATVLGFD